MLVLEEDSPLPIIPLIDQSETEVKDPFCHGLMKLNKNQSNYDYVKL